jgi:hypothetical protein
MYALQNQNVERKIAKKIDINHQPVVEEPVIKVVEDTNTTSIVDIPLSVSNLLPDPEPLIVDSMAPTSNVGSDI